MPDQPPPDGSTTRERLEMHLAQALTRAHSLDVRRHLEAALVECRQLPPKPLVECHLCGRVGLLGGICEHHCSETRREG